MLDQLNFIYPEMWLLTATCLVLLVSLFVKNIDSHWPALLTKLSLVLGLLLVIDQYDRPPQMIFNNLYMVDGISIILKFFILLVGLIAFVYSRNYVLMRRLPEAEYYLLGFFSLLGMMVLCSAYTLLMIYLGLELMSLPLYAMVALQKDKSEAVEAAVKYFVMGAIASGIMLYGMSIIYGVTGKVGLLQLNDAVHHVSASTNGLVLFGLMFIVAGTVFKFASVPFHMWAPDVYQGAPASVAMLIASAPKIAAFGMLYRLLGNGFLPLLPQIQTILAVIAVASILIGNVIAISQTNIRRMFGYSAIAHSGYALLGVIAGTGYGFSATMFYVITYALTTVLAFGALVLLSHYEVEVETLDDLKGLNKRSPWFALMMLISIFSMAGIPPAVGFFAKLMVLRALVLEGWIWLAVIALFLAIFGCFYYIRVVRLMYFEEPDDYMMPVMSLDSKIIFLLNGSLLLGLGIVPSYLWFYCQNVLA